MRSPTERTLKWLRDRGYIPCVVERRIYKTLRPKPGQRVKAACPSCGHQAKPKGLITKDFCGFADIIAFRPGPPTLDTPAIEPTAEYGYTGAIAVQTTSAQHLAERVEKVQTEPRATAWLQCGNRILVMGWALRGGAGSRKLWTPTVQELTPDGHAVPYNDRPEGAP